MAKGLRDNLTSSSDPTQKGAGPGNGGGEEQHGAEPHTTADPAPLGTLPGREQTGFGPGPPFGPSSKGPAPLGKHRELRSMGFTGAVGWTSTGPIIEGFIFLQKNVPG